MVNLFNLLLKSGSEICHTDFSCLSSYSEVLYDSSVPNVLSETCVSSSS